MWKVMRVEGRADRGKATGWDSGYRAGRVSARPGEQQPVWAQAPTLPPDAHISNLSVPGHGACQATPTEFLSEELLEMSTGGPPARQAWDWDFQDAEAPRFHAAVGSSLCTPY